MDNYRCEVVVERVEMSEVMRVQEEARNLGWFGVTVEEGTRIKITYLGAEYTGAVTDYIKTPSGDYALGVDLDVEAGKQVKYFLSKNKPIITSA